jgi:hypothetical protein
MFVEGGYNQMKNLALAVLLFMMLFGFGSARAEIANYSAPSTVYVGQPWNVNPFYVANDQSLCAPSPKPCLDGWVTTVATGDLTLPAQNVSLAK